MRNRLTSFNLKRAATLVAALFLVSCRSVSGHKNKLLTELGADNESVAERFELYKAKKSHCFQSAKTKARYRVILAGFGPFSGVEFNTSSLVAMNFADQFGPSQKALRSPIINNADADGIIRQDVVTINGIDVEICAISTSVIWDLAAAIYLHEASLFKPDLIIMTGMDGGNHQVGTWEQYALNIAKPSSGFESDGSESVIKPVAPTDGSEPVILPNGPDSLKMTWNAFKLLEVTRPIVKQKFPDFDVQTSVDENPGKYLCNNVSYVVLAGLAGHKLPLAGGRLNLRLSGLSGTKAGFFHYPWDSKQDAEAVRNWSEVMAAAISSELSQKH